MVISEGTIWHIFPVKLDRVIYLDIERGTTYHTVIGFWGMVFKLLGIDTHGDNTMYVYYAVGSNAILCRLAKIAAYFKAVHTLYEKRK